MANNIEITIERKTFIKAKIGDHEYRIECFDDSRYGEAADALFSMTQYCIQANQNALQAMKESIPVVTDSPKSE